jgi:acetyl esterase/lipase
MLVPRALSKISPGSAPIGYYFVAADFIAVKVGLEKIVDLTPAVPGDIEEIKNIEYKNAGGKSLQLDLYRPRNLSGPAPLLVFIHGGGWSGGDRKDYLVYLLSFARKGYVTATISYRLLKDGTYPACVEDVCDAFRWFYMNGSEYGYDPERIAAIGGSAGAHLAMLAAYGWKKEGADSSSQRPYSIKAVVEIYGPTDLTTEYARNHNLVTRFLARSYKDDPDLYTEASPVHWAGSSAPPTLILHGTADQLVPVSQADLLKEKLDSLGIPAPIFKLPLWPHTMDLVSRVNLYIQDRISDFLEKYLKPTGTGPQ